MVRILSDKDVYTAIEAILSAVISIKTSIRLISLPINIIFIATPPSKVYNITHQDITKSIYLFIPH